MPRIDIGLYRCPRQKNSVVVVVYREPTVVVFKISLSENFSPPLLTPTTITRSCPHAMRRLCIGSKKSQVCSRHHVQVQSPFSTALSLIYYRYVFSRHSYYYYPSKHSSIRYLPNYSINLFNSNISTRCYLYIYLIFLYLRLSSI